jgi:hypothetical protein
MSELIAKLKAVVLGESVLVPARFDVSCLEKLSLIAGSGIVAEGRRIVKLLYAMANQTIVTTVGCGGSPVSVHAQMENIAKATMGIVNPYWLCRIHADDAEMAPEDVLKLLATLGSIESSIGQPVASVVVAVALAPKPVVPHYSSYLAEWLGRKQYDEKFFMDKKAKAHGEAVKRAILKLKDEFILFKYHGLHIDCGQVPTPASHPIEDVDVAVWYEEHKPEGA